MSAAEKSIRRPRTSDRPIVVRQEALAPEPEPEKKPAAKRKPAARKQKEPAAEKQPLKVLLCASEAMMIKSICYRPLEV